jgi:hypothetical protein
MIIRQQDFYFFLPLVHGSGLRHRVSKQRCNVLVG